MRDRLIELIKKAKQEIKYNPFNCDIGREMFLADHLLANGVIVPPCKVGQTVYIIDEPDFAEDFVLDVKVSEIGQDLKGMWIGLELPLGMRLSQYVYPNNLGKSVFLTKEEAEEKLRERSGEDVNL